MTATQPLTNNNQHGQLSLLTLVILGVFAVIMIAGAAMIARIAHYTTDQEAEERAFAAADAGIHYATFLLHSDYYDTNRIGRWIGNDTPLTNPQTGATVSTFRLLMDPAAPRGRRTVTMTSLGKDYTNPTVCQSIIATYKLSPGPRDPDMHKLVSWVHQASRSCDIYDL